MFDRVRKLKERETAPHVRILAVTQNAVEWSRLQEIANQCGWTLLWARDCDAAISLLAADAIPIVICDRDLPGQDWRSALQRIGASRQPICILLASSVSDEYLWREVVQHRGFDVLTKPFQPDRVQKVVNLAQSWDGWMRHR
jgi:DNA-binding response OmpR family regulator